MNSNDVRNATDVRDKILVFNTSFFNVSQTFIWQQVDILNGSYDIHLLGMAFMNPHNYDMEKWHKHKVTRASGIINRITNKLLGMNFFDFRSYLILYRLFRENRFKAVHAHFGNNALLILPVVRYFRAPLVVTFHGADASRMVRNRSYMRKLPGLFDYASAIIIVSKHMMDTLNLERWKDKVFHIPCTADPDDFFPVMAGEVNTEFHNMNDSSQIINPGKRPQEPEMPVKGDNGNKTIRIVHSGRITPKKGVPDLIIVFRRLAERYAGIELHIMGDGDELDICRSLVREFNLEGRVFFYGAVSHDENKSLMRSADIFVLNSRIAEDGDMEGTPVSLQEAMCLGKAVISTFHAGIPDVINSGINGLLVPERNNAGLETAIGKLITDKELRISLAVEARKTILESFMPRDLENKLMQVFRSL